MFISEAWAQSAGGLGGADTLMSLLPFALIIAVFYFLVIRPQTKQRKEHQEMIKNLRRGDKVITTGGLIGVVAKVTEGSDDIQLDVGEGLKVKVLRPYIAQLLSKNEPVSTAKKSGGKSKSKKDEAEAEETAGDDADKAETAIDADPKSEESEKKAG